MKHSTPTPTKADKARFEKLWTLGCAACIQIGYRGCGPLEIHHQLSGNKRISHQATVPLGKWHHQGVPLEGMTASTMEAVYGPSLALTSKRFRVWFGTDEQLLAEVNARIAR